VTVFMTVSGTCFLVAEVPEWPRTSKEWLTEKNAQVKVVAPLHTITGRDRTDWQISRIYDRIWRAQRRIQDL